MVFVFCFLLSALRDLTNVTRSRTKYCALATDSSWDGFLVVHRTRDRGVASSNLGRSGGQIFISSVNFVCWFLFGVHSAPVLPQRHVKDPSYSAKSAGGRLPLNTHTPLTHRSHSGLTMPLSRYSVGTYQERSSQTQLVREHSATVVSARWATVGWSWPKEWN